METLCKHKGYFLNRKVSIGNYLVVNSFYKKGRGDVLPSTLWYGIYGE